MSFDLELKGVTRVFTLGYRMNDNSLDPWTQRFNAFKSKDPDAVLGASSVMKEAVPALVQGLDLDISRTVLVPALSSGEAVASKQGVLWGVVRGCALRVGARFVGDAITKKPHEPLHRGKRSDVDRQKLLWQAEYKSARIEAQDILVFDDFITIGATMSQLAQAIRKSNQEARIYGVALGRTVTLSYSRGPDVDISNDHIPEHMERLWQSAGSGSTRR